MLECYLIIEGFCFHGNVQLRLKLNFTLLHKRYQNIMWKNNVAQMISHSLHNDYRWKIESWKPVECQPLNANSTKTRSCDWAFWEGRIIDGHAIQRIFKWFIWLLCFVLKMWYLAHWIFRGMYVVERQFVEIKCSSHFRIFWIHISILFTWNYSVSKCWFFTLLQMK